jgi:hypothetical protein
MDAWPIAGPLLQKVVDAAPEELTLAGIHGRIVSGEENLALVMNDQGVAVAAFTIGIQTFDTGMKSLSIPVIGGEGLPRWIGDITEEVQELAATYGCKQIRAYGARKGWLRAFREYGAFDGDRCTLKMRVGE